MKILNLYAGIGGNRKLWGDEHEITAVESEQYIADVYGELYPNDTVVVSDAHQYILDHFKEFDFIWSSPPCPTHSKLSTGLAGWGIYRFPNMMLYEEIIFLQTFFEGDWVIENVVPYYDPLILPVARLDRHLFWSNRHIPKTLSGRNFQGQLSNATKEALQNSHGIKLPAGTKNARKLLRNAVDPKLGLHIFEAVAYQRVNPSAGDNMMFELGL